MLSLTNNNKNNKQCVFNEDSYFKSDLKIGNSKNWCNLPSTVLENIYIYLDRKDQYSMSLVCKNWLKEYSSPALWKNITYNLSEHFEKRETLPKVKLAQKFGYMFRHIEIVGKLLIRNEIPIAHYQLKAFLETIMASNNHLHSISFKHMHRHCQYLNETEYTDFMICMEKFLGSQQSLRCIEFHNCNFRRLDCIKFLSVIFQNNSFTLNRIVLKGFAMDQMDNLFNYNTNNEFRNLLEGFINVHKVEMNYSKFFEDIITSVGSQNRFETTGKLTVLDLFCEGSKRMHYEGIQSTSWKVLRALCPLLKIRLNLVYSTHVRWPLEFYLVDYMPLAELECRVEKTINTQNIFIEDLFRQICRTKINQTLECLSVIWMPAVHDISEHLTDFLYKTPRLKTLQMFFNHSVYGFEVVFESWLQNRPTSLESVYLSIRHMQQEEDRWNLVTLADEYYPLFQVMGINLILLIDSV